MLVLLVLGTIGGLTTGHLLPSPNHQSAVKERDYCPVLYTEPPTDCRPLPRTFVEFRRDDYDPPRAGPDVLEDAYEALEILQDEFFDADYGAWPSAIDWTAAVVETVVSGMLTTLTKSIDTLSASDQVNGWKAKENLLSSYFADVINSYYGQDILSLRGEVRRPRAAEGGRNTDSDNEKAYDDMLWVVLGWIESVNFVREHAKRHYVSDESADAGNGSSRLRKALQNKPWHGEKWVPAFAHRARIFWNLASHGWDTKLCGGGMVWNRWPNPYKNAITNELWISASISMYQFWPGDNITSPWAIDDEYRRKDPEHLAAAIEGYKWLMNVNMTNELGLFVDGYHISRHRGSTQCDLRDEMVYTYNQGVLLTGHRGLWTVTGSASYLENGHNLIQSVINATGWDLRQNIPADTPGTHAQGRLPVWRGMGRGGIMEERCDASGTCSQDGQTFKGIFFHHLTTFCAPLDPMVVAPGVTLDVEGFQRVRTAHAEACDHYLAWVRHNALAAMGTRGPQGVYGMWWGAGLFGETIMTEADDGIDHEAANTTDYRNKGTPRDDIWGDSSQHRPSHQDDSGLMVDGLTSTEMDQVLLSSPRAKQQSRTEVAVDRDPNDRGRGRTIETQMGGLALLRAYWELSQVDEMV